jgi:hypothetical protein
VIGGLARTLNLGLCRTPPNRTHQSVGFFPIVSNRLSPNAGFKNAMQYSLVVEVRSMLTVSWRDFAGPTMLIVAVCAAVMPPVDIPNDRANWPIPEALQDMGAPTFFRKGARILFRI